MKTQNSSEWPISKKQAKGGQEVECVRPDFNIRLTTNTDDFLRTPHQSQRAWLLQRTVGEFASDLEALDSAARRFVPGSSRQEISGHWEASHANYSESELTISGQQVMQRWETPLMKALAEIAAETHGDVLEVGFGMGLAAGFIQQTCVKSHTIIECNSEVFSVAQRWQQGFPKSTIHLCKGRWQEVIGKLGRYDAVLFDTYPLNEQEFYETVVQSVTFAQHFFSSAARLLRPGGTFTYYTNEIDSFSRRHQRVLFDHFRRIELSIVRPLFPPPDCNYWWAVAVIKATK